MSDWKFLNTKRISLPMYPDTDASWGFNGVFEFFILNCNEKLRVVASDGHGWQHVSVSFGPEKKHITPRWDVMCRVKDLFWEDDDVVVQFHPRKRDYVNYHGGCLHMWRCTDGREFPTPPSILVGPKQI